MCGPVHSVGSRQNAWFRDSVGSMVPPARVVKSIDLSCAAWGADRAAETRSPLEWAVEIFGMGALDCPIPLGRG